MTKHYGYKTALPMPLDKQQVAEIARFHAREQVRVATKSLADQNDQNAEKLGHTDASLDDVNARIIALSVRVRTLEARAHEHWWTKLGRDAKELYEIYKGI